MKQFHDEERLHIIWVNHDMIYLNPNYVETHLSAFFRTKTEEEEDLFCDIKDKVYFKTISD
tara:strand:- start:721 stop:903 length:183 start_codon:yes stop_codon:yes gene_type:complete